MKNNINIGSKRVILHNKIKCNKCGDIIESYDVHDFKYCKCQTVFVDGGHEYLRRGFKNSPDDYTELSESVAINSRGVNACIKYNLLSPEEMEKLGFVLEMDEDGTKWVANIPLKEYKIFNDKNEYCLEISLPANHSDDDLDIVVINEELSSPFDYQYVLSHPYRKKNMVAKAVKEEVENIIEKLQKVNLISGHKKNDYI